MNGGLAKLSRFHLHVRGGYYVFLRPRNLARLARMYALDRVNRRHYRLLSEEELLATRTSDTAFVFGSGRSLLKITPEEWQAIARFNTISLREFPRQQWIRADYHLTGELVAIDDYAQRLRENPRYANTVFVVHSGLRAEAGNELIGRRLLPEGARVFRFRRVARWRDALPSRSPRRLVHAYNSIFDATNLAVALGYRRIVLAGADYYNKEYFWLPPGETRPDEGVPADERWGGAEAIVSLMGHWHDHLALGGIELAVYNPRSLLARRLPVFRR